MRRGWSEVSPIDAKSLEGTSGTREVETRKRVRQKDLTRKGGPEAEDLV